MLGLAGPILRSTDSRLGESDGTGRERCHDRYGRHHEFDLAQEHGSQDSFGNDSDRCWNGARRCRVNDRRLCQACRHSRSSGAAGGCGRQRSRWCHAPTHEPPAQPFPSPGEAALDRSDRASQMTRGLLVGAALEITEHHRNPEATRQAVDLLMDDLLEVVIVGHGAAAPPIRAGARPPRVRASGA